MRLSLAKYGMKISIGENSHYSQLLTQKMYEFMSCENFFRRSGLYCQVHGLLYGVVGNVSTSAAKKIGVTILDSSRFLFQMKLKIEISNFKLKLKIKSCQNMFYNLLTSRFFETFLGGWVGGWSETMILIKTQSSVQTWTWNLDFDLGFVNFDGHEPILMGCFFFSNICVSHTFWVEFYFWWGLMFDCDNIT